MIARFILGLLMKLTRRLGYIFNTDNAHVSHVKGIWNILIVPLSYASRRCLLTSPFWSRLCFRSRSLLALFGATSRLGHLCSALFGTFLFTIRR